LRAIKESPRVTNSVKRSPLNLAVAPHRLYSIPPISWYNDGLFALRLERHDEQRESF